MAHQNDGAAAAGDELSAGAETDRPLTKPPADGLAGEPTSAASADQADPPPPSRTAPKSIASKSLAGEVRPSSRSSASESHSALSRYITLVKEIPELAREEEAELAGKWLRDGDRDAATKLVNANLRYVVAIALTYRRYGLALSDLVAEGNFGIVHALRKFDPGRGTRFVTYAAYWIRAYILNFVIRSWSLVGVGSGPLRSKLFFRLRRERARIASLVGEGDVGTELLAERFGAPAEKVLSMARRLEARDLSLDTKVFDDGQTTLVDTLESNAQSQEERFAASEERIHLKERLRSALDGLDPRERYIVEARMMADEEDELSLAEIGRRLGVSRERARQLESRVKKKLRAQLTAANESHPAGDRAA